MNRLVMMVLKNFHVAPGAFIKLWRYAAHPERYAEIEMWNHIHYIMQRAVMAGNIDLQVTGLENLPEEDGFMIYANHQGLFDVVAIAATCPTPLGIAFKKELTLKTSFVNPNTQGRAAQIIASGRLNLKDLISERLSLDEINDAFKPGLRNGKTVIIP